jgi:hypothetical protein
MASSCPSVSQGEDNASTTADEQTVCKKASAAGEEATDGSDVHRGTGGRWAIRPWTDRAVGKSSCWLSSSGPEERRKPGWTRKVK